MKFAPTFAPHVGACALAVAVIGCRDAAPEAGEFSAELYGARAVERTSGDALRPWFDLEKGPFIRVEGDCGACRVRLVGEATTALTCARSTDDALRLRCDLGSAPLGPARLDLRDDAGRGVHWPVVITPTPKATPTSDARSHALWASLEAARQTMKQGMAAATVGWREAAEEAVELRVPSEAAQRYQSAAYFALRQNDIVSAQRFETAAKLHLVSAQGRTGQLFIQGLIALASHDLRTAARRLRAAEALARRMGDARVLRHCQSSLAGNVLLDTGRPEAAVATLAQLSASATTDHDRARLALNHGFALLRLALERDPTQLAAAKARIVEAVALANAHEFKDLLADNYTHLAWVCHALGDAPCATQALAKARAAQTTHASMFEPAALDLLEGEVHLGAGQLDAATAAFRRRINDGASEATWRARFGLGRIALQRKDEAAALAQLRMAGEGLRRVARNVALRADRGRYLDQRSELLDATLDLLLARGEAAEAFVLADAHQAQVLRSLTADVRIPRLSADASAGWQARVGAWKSAQAAWQEAAANPAPMTDAERAAHTAQTVVLKSAAEAAFDAAAEWLDGQSPDQTPASASVATVQAALGADETLIEFIPAGKTWRAFWVDKTQVRVSQVAPDADPLAAMLQIAPIPGHLYVVTGGRRDLYDLNQRGLSVSYLPHAGFLSRAQRGDGAHLAAVDPENDLPFARTDATHLPDGALALVGAAVKRAAVLDRLAGARVFHFSGHGVLHEADPWDAHLRLADGRLTLSDVLMSRMPGATVVLSGCKTGAPAVLGRRDVVGLPEAFLAAGARAVIATGRDVPDREASLFVEHFYGSGGATRPGAGLKAAIAALRARKLDSWTAWRLIGRPD